MLTNCWCTQQLGTPTVGVPNSWVISQNIAEQLGK